MHKASHGCRACVGGFLSPVLFWILNSFGWRALFVAVGEASAWPPRWCSWAECDPADHPTVTRAELEQALAAEMWAAARLFRPAADVALFAIDDLGGSASAVRQVGSLFFTWFPMPRHRAATWADHVGIFPALPHIAGFLVILFAGGGRT